MNFQCFKRISCGKTYFFCEFNALFRDKSTGCLGKHGLYINECNCFLNFKINGSILQSEVEMMNLINYIKISIREVNSQVGERVF